MTSTIDFELGRIRALPPALRTAAYSILRDRMLTRGGRERPTETTRMVAEEAERLAERLAEQGVKE